MTKSIQNNAFGKTLNNLTLAGTTSRSGTIGDVGSTLSGTATDGRNIIRTGETVLRSGTTQDAGGSAAVLGGGDLLTGFIAFDCGGAGVTATTDTAANILGEMTDPAVGDTFEVTILNASDAAEDLTLAADASVTFINLGSNLVISQGEIAHIKVTVTNATAASEAVTMLITKS